MASSVKILLNKSNECISASFIFYNSLTIVNKTRLLCFETG